ncbi:hypothetical protein [Chryseobacterium sp. C3]|nr:hypothetical protein [Chryseobacterium sp. C3]
MMKLFFDYFLSFAIQSTISVSTFGEIVCSISEYSENAPVVAS